MLVVVLYFKERISEASKLCGNDLYNSAPYLKSEKKGVSKSQCLNKHSPFYFLGYKSNSICVPFSLNRRL
jgi:hypothetical protein